MVESQAARLDISNFELNGKGQKPNQAEDFSPFESTYFKLIKVCVF